MDQDYLEEYRASLYEHLRYVREAGTKLGIPMDLLFAHDQSKFNIKEFEPYARNFKGDKGDPDSFARAWLHHIHKNPHHWQHFIFPDGFTMKGSTMEFGGLVRMPTMYVREMVADWMGSSMAYTGSWNMTNWLTKNLPKIKLHSSSFYDLMGILKGLGYPTNQWE